MWTVESSELVRLCDAWEQQEEQLRQEEATLPEAEQRAARSARRERRRVELTQAKASSPEEAQAACDRAVKILHDLSTVATTLDLEMCAAQMNGWNDNDNTFLTATLCIDQVLAALQTRPTWVTRAVAVPTANLHPFVAGEHIEDLKEEIRSDLAL